MHKRIASLAATAAAAAAGAALIGLGTGTSGAATGLSAQDQNYLMTSAEGDAFEIRGGKVAMQKGSSAKVRRLGHRLRHDHTKSFEETKTLASHHGVKVDEQPSPPEAWELAIVNQKTGPDFDHWYADLEVQDHKQDITETLFEIHHGTNPQVVASARKELPTLKTHLRLSRNALK